MAALCAPSLALASDVIVRGSDFSVISRPKDPRQLCAPIFFCRTRPEGTSKSEDYPPAEKSFTRRKQIGWCSDYAAAVLGKKVAPKQLLLVQIDPTVGLSRLRTIAQQVAKSADCSGDWPPNQPKTIASATWAQKNKLPSAGSVILSAPASPLGRLLRAPAPPEDDERGVVLLQPEVKYTDPAQAERVGPDYSQPGVLTDVSDIPTEKEVRCDDLIEEYEEEMRCANEAE